MKRMLRTEPGDQRREWLVSNRRLGKLRSTAGIQRMICFKALPATQGCRELCSAEFWQHGGWHCKLNRRNCGPLLSPPARKQPGEPNVFSSRLSKGKETPQKSQGPISTSTKNVATPFNFHKAGCDGPPPNVRG